MRPETRYGRFLTSLKLLDPGTRSRLASVDHRDHEAITAVASDGTVVAIARYLRAAGSITAEVAVAVVDRWRGRGLASLLLDRIAVRARAAGIRSLTAWCLASNGAIIRLLRRLGPATIDPSAAGVVHVRIELTGAGRDPRS